MKKLTSLILLMFMVHSAAAGQSFSEWCTNYGGTAVITNTHITELDGLAPRSPEKTGLYYTPIANTVLSKGYHYYISNKDKAVYDTAKIAYLTGALVDACTLTSTSSDQNTYLVGVKMSVGS